MTLLALLSWFRAALLDRHQAAVATGVASYLSQADYCKCSIAVWHCFKMINNLNVVEHQEPFELSNTVYTADCVELGFIRVFEHLARICSNACVFSSGNQRCL